MTTRLARTISRLGGIAVLALCASASASLASTAEAGPHMRWVDAANGEVPHGAIAGGWEEGRTLYVCRGWYNGGVHPGKIVGNHCNIGWGGAEVLLNRYQVMVGDGYSMRWVDASRGEAPMGAISGGQEPGRPSLYVCRVDYYGMQPGKLVGENCNIGYGGRELYFPSYQILVQTRYSRPAPGHRHHRHGRYR